MNADTHAQESKADLVTIGCENQLQKKIL